MAHEIWQDSTGKDCMFVVGKREDAWHLLGQRVPQAVTWQQAMDLAGLNWEVMKIQLQARNPKGIMVGQGVIPSFGIFRKSDGEYLGTVGAEFSIKQNRELFQYLDAFVESDGGAHYDSAGALGRGERIWVSIRVPAADINVLGVDKQHMYLMFYTAHDGSVSHTTCLSAVRPVCANTVRAALSSANGILRIKHTKNQDQRFEAAKKAVMGVTMDAKNLQTKLEMLATRKMTKESMVTVLDRLFPKQEGDAQQTQSTARRDNVLIEILRLFESNDKDAVPEIRGTAYNMLNAVTEYTDHVRSARITDNRKGYTVERARAENAVVGTGEKLKSSALAVLEEVAADLPTYDPRSFAVPKPAQSIISDDELNRMFGAGD